MDDAVAKLTYHIKSASPQGTQTTVRCQNDLLPDVKHPSSPNMGLAVASSAPSAAVAPPTPCARCGGRYMRDLYDTVTCLNCGHSLAPPAETLPLLKTNQGARKYQRYGKRGPE